MTEALLAPGGVLVGWYAVAGVAEAWDRAHYPYPHSDKTWVEELAYWWSLAVIVIVLMAVIA